MNPETPREPTPTVSTAQWDRRQSPRIDITGIRATGFGANFIGRYEVSDLSKHGALLGGGPRLPVASPLDLYLRDSQDGSIVIRAHVARHGLTPRRQIAIGVRFCGLKPDAADFVQELLHTEIASRREPRVLLVAPAAERAQRLESDLRAIGCRVRRATTPLDAIVAMQDRAQPVSTLVIDSTDPNSEGVEFVQLAADSFPKVRRIWVDDSSEACSSARVAVDGLVDHCLPAQWTRPHLREVFDRECREPTDGDGS